MIQPFGHEMLSWNYFQIPGISEDQLININLQDSDMKPWHCVLGPFNYYVSLPGGVGRVWHFVTGGGGVGRALRNV